jgi:hypothetical protein
VDPETGAKLWSESQLGIFTPSRLSSMRLVSASGLKAVGRMAVDFAPKLLGSGSGIIVGSAMWIGQGDSAKGTRITNGGSSCGRNCRCILRTVHSPAAIRYGLRLFCLTRRTLPMQAYRQLVTQAAMRNMSRLKQVGLSALPWPGSVSS